MATPLHAGCNHVPSSQSSSLPSPHCQLVSGYVLTQSLGIGTYGEVRAALHVATRRAVAVKVIDTGRNAGTSKQIVSSEIKYLKLAKHRNVIGLIDTVAEAKMTGQWCDDCACTAFTTLNAASQTCATCNHPLAHHSQLQYRTVMLIVQEIAIGGELFTILSHSGPLSEQLARYYFHQIIDGVDALHSHHIIHRDLKPENLCLDHNFALKIVDFGLATMRRQHRRVPYEDECDSGDEWAAQHHTGVGSQPYTAPEVYYVNDLYNHRPYKGSQADLWSCAVILYVMLTGKPPFVRPLTKTYSHKPELKRDKHFVALLKGESYGGMSKAAAVLLSNMFRVHPDDRLTIESIRQDEWYNGPLPTDDDVIAMMSERAKTVYTKLNKLDVCAIMMRMMTQGEESLSTLSQFTLTTHHHNAHHLHDTNANDVPSSAPMSIPQHHHASRHTIAANANLNKAKRGLKLSPPPSFDDKVLDRHDVRLLQDDGNSAKEMDDLSVRAHSLALSISPPKRNSPPLLLPNHSIDSSLPLPMLISRIQRTLISLSLQLKYSLPTLNTTSSSSSQTISPPSTPRSSSRATSIACTIHVSGVYGIRHSAVVSDIFVHRNTTGRVQSVECVNRTGCQLNRDEWDHIINALANAINCAEEKDDNKS